MDKLSLQMQARSTYKDVMRDLLMSGLSLAETLEQPKMKELRELRELLPTYEENNHYQQIYDKEFMYIWAFRGTYSIDYFVAKFEAIPDEEITRDSVDTFCGAGYAHNRLDSEEMKTLLKFVYEDHLHTYYLCDNKSLGKTPKERLMKALKTIQQQCRNLREVSQAWDDSISNAKSGEV